MQNGGKCFNPCQQRGPTMVNNFQVVSSCWQQFTMSPQFLFSLYCKINV